MAPQHEGNEDMVSLENGSGAGETQDWPPHNINASVV